MRKDQERSLPSGIESEAFQMLTKIAVIRHGDYETGGRLTEKGISQIQAIGQRLMQVLDPKETALVLSSDAQRAMHSSEILSGILNAQIEYYRVLRSEKYGDENYDVAYELVRKARERANLAVVVTHYEYVNGFPVYLMERDLGESSSHELIGKGEGVLIDYVARSLRML